MIWVRVDSLTWIASKIKKSIQWNLVIIKGLNVVNKWHWMFETCLILRKHELHYRVSLAADMNLCVATLTSWPLRLFYVNGSSEPSTQQVNDDLPGLFLPWIHVYDMMYEWCYDDDIAGTAFPAWRSTAKPSNMPGTATTAPSSTATSAIIPLPTHSHSSNEITSTTLNNFDQIVCYYH